jgi:hypothetical protein
MFCRSINPMLHSWACPGGRGCGPSSVSVSCAPGHCDRCMRQMHKGVYSQEGALKLAAMLDGAEYAAERMRGAHASSDKDEILLRALEQASHNGLFLEFGVWSGRTNNLIAERVNATVHGFDSFQGLPEDWQPGYRRGRFHTNGRLPSVRPNVTLHVGWFHATLPTFTAKYDGPIAFLHVDCDLYSSTKTISSTWPTVCCPVRSSSSTNISTTRMAKPRVSRLPGVRRRAFSPLPLPGV